MSSEWLMFGACAAIDEMGYRVRSNSAKRDYESQMSVAKMLRCSKELESELWSMVGDPSKYDEVWDRIELFKRKNPHLCLAKEWEIVGTRRFPLHTAKSSARSAILSLKTATVRLLCRTYGKLTPDHASELALENNFYKIWLSSGDNDSVQPVWTSSSQSSFESMQRSFRDGLAEKKDKLRQEIRSATEEQHDAIVYMSSLEYDPSVESAVDYVTDTILNLAVPAFDAPQGVPDGVCQAITPEDYEKYVADGGVDSPFIRQSIESRRRREETVRSERLMNYVPQNEQFSSLLGDIMWSNKIANLPSSTAPTMAAMFGSAVKDDFISSCFNGSFSGILYFVLIIVVVLVALASIVSFMAEF